MGAKIQTLKDILTKQANEDEQINYEEIIKNNVTKFDASYVYWLYKQRVV